MNGWHAPAPPTSLDLTAVPVVGQMSTTSGWSVADALTASTGSVLLDAGAGAAIGYLVAPRSQRTLLTAAGALAAGGLGVLGVLGIVGASVLLRRRG